MELFSHFVGLRSEFTLIQRLECNELKVSEIWDSHSDVDKDSSSLGRGAVSTGKYSNRRLERLYYHLLQDSPLR